MDGGIGCPEGHCRFDYWQMEDRSANVLYSIVDNRKYARGSSFEHCLGDTSSLLCRSSYFLVDDFVFESCVAAGSRLSILDKDVLDSFVTEDTIQPRKLL